MFSPQIASIFFAEPLKFLYNAFLYNTQAVIGRINLIRRFDVEIGNDKSTKHNDFSGGSQGFGGASFHTSAW